MCGLVGIAGDCTLKMKDVFTELLYHDTVRGDHSTGVALVKREHNDFLLEKAPVPGTLFVGTQEYKKLIETFGVKALIGHNRFATIGDKTSENAHPFAFDHIVGAHNGTLDKFALKNLDNADTFGTDSAALYNSINNHGLKKTMAKVTGAWALTFFDKDDNSINLLRNSKRPLFYAYTHDMETLIWASESGMLSWIVGRNNFKLFENRIFECAADTHYRWSVPDFYRGKFEKPVVNKVEGEKFIFKQHNHNSHVYGEVWDDYGNYKTFDENLKEVVKKIPVKERPKINTKKFRPPYKDAYGHIMNKGKFHELVKNGCLYCDNNQQQWGDFIHPLKDDMEGRKLYLCDDCYNDDDIRELVESSI